MQNRRRSILAAAGGVTLAAAGVVSAIVVGGDTGPTLTAGAVSVCVSVSPQTVLANTRTVGTIPGKKKCAAIPTVTVGSTTSPTTTAVEPVAHVFMAPPGTPDANQTCTRNPVLVTYSQAEVAGNVCDNMNGAYQAALPGDTVLVEGGQPALATTTTYMPVTTIGVPRPAVDNSTPDTTTP